MADMEGLDPEALAEKVSARKSKVKAPSEIDVAKEKRLAAKEERLQNQEKSIKVARDRWPSLTCERRDHTSSTCPRCICLTHSWWGERRRFCIPSGKLQIKHYCNFLYFLPTPVVLPLTLRTWPLLRAPSVRTTLPAFSDLLVLHLFVAFFVGLSTQMRPIFLGKLQIKPNSHHTGRREQYVAPDSCSSDWRERT